MSCAGFASKADRQQMLSFYLDKNPPGWRDYLVENQLVLVQE